MAGRQTPGLSFHEALCGTRKSSRWLAQRQAAKAGWWERLRASNATGRARPAEPHKLAGENVVSRSMKKPALRSVNKITVYELQKERTIPVDATWTQVVLTHFK